MKFVFSIVLLISISGKAQILNTESLRMVTDTTGWAGSVALNLGYSKNVKELFKIDNHIHIQYKNTKHLVLFMNKISFEKADNAEFVNKGVQHLRYNYKIYPQLNWEMFFQNQYNAISKIDFRELLGTGPRYKIFKSERYKVYIASLILYEYEKTFEGIPMYHRDWRNSNYFTFSLLLTKNTKLVSTTYYQPKIFDFSDYRVAHQSSILFKIVKNLSFKIAFNFAFDKYPVVGIPKKEIELTNGLLYKF